MQQILVILTAKAKEKSILQLSIQEDNYRKCFPDTYLKARTNVEGLQKGQNEH